MSAQEFPKYSLALGGMPKKLFGYDVIDFLGEGAGSMIYVVTDPVSNQLYALKYVQRKADKDIRFIEQLEAEHEVSKRFSHAALRKSIDLKINKTILRKVIDAVLIMELFDGTPLDARRPESLASCCSIFSQTASALAELHHLGYVHCDLKPNNILVGPTGTVKVIDFGQACKVGTVKERIQGTPDYISPEQVKCEPVTTRTDVFNFGATLYWALTGQKIPTLFTLKKDENSFLLDSKFATPRDLNPAVPDVLSNLVIECIRTNPAKRPGDLGELARRLGIMGHAATVKNRGDAPAQPQPGGLRASSGVRV